MSDAAADRERAGFSLQMEVSNAMVRIYKEVFGRGPTKARTNFAGPDLLVCTLEDSFTPAERNLRDMGEHQRLRDLRLYLQYASEHRFRGTIEQITGRTVTGFISGIDAEQDLSVEIFYLEPETDRRP
jgi:uncharacterized protein YbcI